MRRSSNARLLSQTSEPLIVVEDQPNDDEASKASSSRQSSEEESIAINPYLLSPYAREIRKQSLPTPQCSGITASQVRRLSERGETGPGPRQAEFLATLSSAPTPSPGGRRHSVVTISKVPTTIFGRNRRESVAAYPGPAFPNRILPNRRESIACPPSTESRGSVHNLQLDIMDDIVQARKVRMKLWNTSKEKLCEVQPLDEAGSVQRYSNSGRRFSEFVGTTLPPIPSSSKRRSSDIFQIPAPSSSKQKSGIVCSNTDLISILSSLSTSATEINQMEAEKQPPTAGSVAVQEKRSRLKGSRSNSFDISVLHGDLDQLDSEPKPCTTPSNWFAKRHQPMAQADDNKFKKLLSFSKDTLKTVVKNEPGKVVWDEKSGSLIDAQALGSAIEVFLRQTSPDGGTVQEPPTDKNSKVGNKNSDRAKSSWFSKEEEEATENCDSSICSTLKDLFVK